MKPNAPFTHLAFAYQLHYYLCVRTKRNDPFLAASVRQAIEKHLGDICEREGVHLLRVRVRQSYFRLVLSLKPEHVIASVVGKLKGNLSRRLAEVYPFLKAGEIWSRGYFVKSVRTPTPCGAGIGSPFGPRALSE